MFFVHKISLIWSVLLYLPCISPFVCAKLLSTVNPLIKEDETMIMDRIALIITVIGALNWGSIGLFKFDIVAWLFGGQDALISRIVYTVVALAGIWCISLIFRARERFESIDE